MVTRNSAVPYSLVVTITRAAADPDQGVATYVGADYNVRTYNLSADTSPDITLTKGSGVVVESEAADAATIRLEWSTSQIADLINGLTPKLIPNDPNNRKGFGISYSISVIQKRISDGTSYSEKQGNDDTAWTGIYYILATDGLAGR